MLRVEEPPTCTVKLDEEGVEHKQMTPAGALEYVRSRRPRVLLAPSQWKSVVEYSMRRQPASTIHSPSELVILPRMVSLIPMIARLSCLLAPFKVPGVFGPLFPNKKNVAPVIQMRKDPNKSLLKEATPCRKKMADDHLASLFDPFKKQHWPHGASMAIVLLL
ncbi:Leucine-rich repeat family protein / extensin family protein [Hibiscus syriacus]|uniref:Leucine-rich repeat family protein / extensin family protein n=1 Tax=Hibiscus syriacus TaxID=106335 RepID=A0A6A3D1E1_HIBSY|nr:Leucine-rich repeat family protein / extensin family protein [Hibiscus syriacus]